MKAICLSILTLALSACGLTPKQMQALDGAMCTKTSGYGITNTTAIVAGASKGSGVLVNGETCSISAAGK
jgi:hypothetical protein